MKFCEKCGSYMRAEKGGFKCTKCGHTVLSESLEIQTIPQNAPSPIAVIGESEVEQAKVQETCPICGNPEAIRSMSFVSGEHAGVRQERSMERFKCAKCGHTWTKQ